MTSGVHEINSTASPLNEKKRWCLETAWNAPSGPYWSPFPFVEKIAPVEGSNHSTVSARVDGIAVRSTVKLPPVRCIHQISLPSRAFAPGRNPVDVKLPCGVIFANPSFRIIQRVP